MSRLKISEKINMLISIYGRVSSSNQENEGTIETQLSAVYDYASKNGYTIVQKYIDNGWSGDNLARPGLDQLRLDAKKKLWKAVLIYDPDRLARRGAWQEVVIEELQELEIEVLFVTIPQPKTDEEKIMYKMRGVFTEYERMKIKERFRLGKVRKANEGHIIASEAPYGYDFVAKNGKRGDADFHQGYYKINEYESQIVRSIFSWVANDGMSLRCVIRKLQELEIKPRKSKRGVWNTSTLSKLIRNRTYIGEGYYGVSYAVVPTNPIKKEGYKKIKKSSRRSKPKSEWIMIPTPKIIDVKIFSKAAQNLAANFLMSPRNTKNEYLLTGKIWCGCGVRRSGEGPQKGKHLYYRCTGRVKNFPLPPSCFEKGVNARIVDSLVWKGICELMSSPELLNKQIERWYNCRENRKYAPVINYDETKMKISKLKDQESRFLKAYAIGAINVEQLKEYLGPIKEKITNFKNQISKSKSESDSIIEMKLPEKSQIEIFSNKTAEVIKNLNFIVKKAIVRNVIDKVVVVNGELQVYGFIPVTSDVNVFTDYRNGASINRHDVMVYSTSSIPFTLAITLPPPLQRGVDYGFRKAA